MMIKPPKLEAGQRVAAVTPSWGGPGTFPHRYEAGKQQFMRTFGVDVVEMPHTLTPADWLARHPEARAADLMQAFADPSIDGIIATIGGEDSIRLLRHLDLDVIRANPKVFMGYSDVTVIHLACYQTGLVSFYGPAFMAGFAENGGMFPYMIESVRRTLFTAAPAGVIEPNGAGWTVERLDWADPTLQQQQRTLQPSTGWRWLQGTGTHCGHLLGGCVEVLEFLRGTPVWPTLDQWNGAILFIETSEEAPPPSTVARMLRSYAAMGILERLSGMIVGRPGGGVDPASFADYDRAILEIVVDEEGLIDLPIVTQMDFGHTDPMFVLPYGVQAEIDCDRRTFAIIEAAVSES